MHVRIPTKFVVRNVELLHNLVAFEGLCQCLGPFSTQLVGADVKLHQCPDGGKYIRGGTLDILDILDVLALTCTQEW